MGHSLSCDHFRSAAILIASYTLRRIGYPLKIFCCFWISS